MDSIWKITLPLLKPILLYVAITSLIGGLQMFDLPYLMADKASASYNSVQTAVMYLYKFGLKLVRHRQAMHLQLPISCS